MVQVWRAVRLSAFSYGPGPDGHVVDGFELVCKTKKHQITLYVDMYHSGPSPLVPEKLRKADG